MKAVDADLPIFRMKTMDERVGESLARRRFLMTLMVLFTVVAATLAVIGVYSVIAYSVSRQTHEIGIRMALGASRSSVLQMVALMGLKLVAIGGAIGFLASLAATKVLAAQLTNVSRFDPLTLVCVVALPARVLTTATP